MRLQDTYIVEYILGSIDLLIFLIATIQLIRIIRNEKEQQQRVRLNPVCSANTLGCLQDNIIEKYHLFRESLILYVHRYYDKKSKKFNCFSHQTGTRKAQH